jgi:hypothetical protein
MYDYPKAKYSLQFVQNTLSQFMVADQFTHSKINTEQDISHTADILLCF